MSRVDTGRLLGLATKVLAQKAVERAHGGWIPEKQRIKQGKEALRAHEKQKKEAERRSKLQTGGIPDENQPINPAEEQNQPYDLGQQLQTGARFAAEIPASVNRLFIEPVTTGIQELMRPIQEGGGPESYQNPQMVEHAMNVVGGLGAGSMLTGPSAASTNVLRSGMGPVAKEAVAQAPRQLSPLGFYSPAAERAAALQPSGDAAQMVAALKNTPGIKAEELMNAGLIDSAGNVHPEWAGRGKVSREDLVSHLQGQMPQVEETVLQRRSEYPHRTADEWQNAITAAERRGDWDEVERLGVAWEDYEGVGSSAYAGNPPKYEKYTLPGGENYREVLLKLPEQQKKLTEYPVIRPDGLTDGRYDSIQAAARRAMEINGSVGDPINTDTVTGFRSPHWSDLNVLAHIRMADRTGPNGEKILHVEELQSDWGQKGKKEGFASSAPVSKFKIGDMSGFNAEYNDFFNKWLLSSDNQSLGVINQNKKGKYIPEVILRQGVGHNLGEFNTPEEAIDAVKNLQVHGHKQTHSLNEIPIDAEKLTAMYLSKDEAEKAAIKHGIPSAPYVTSTEGWTDLALKRVLKEAAEGGYDKVVWTPGAEQAARYKLSNHVDRIAYDPEEKTLSYVPKDGGGWTDHPGNVEPKDLPEIIGKDAAERLMAQEPNKLSGNYVLESPDLVFGGEGMHGYYDNIVPKRLQAIVKKHNKNAKVGYTDVMLPPSKQRGSNNPPMAAPGIDITPAMRESILRGQSAYQRGGAVRKDFKQAHADARSQGLKTFTWTDPATGKEGTYTTALKRKEGGRVYSLADHNQWKEPS